MPYCLLFPGQGTQFSGMAAGLDLAGLDERLISLMHSGPEEVLNQTVNAQPAVVSASLALWSKSEFKEPALVLGHSLGEYTALAVAGSLSTEETVALVAKRGEYMQASQPGSMAAVIGLEREKIEEVLKNVGDVWVANINAPGQIVVSGKTGSVAEAATHLKAQGAKVLPLKVSVASHCPLMRQASEELAKHLAGVGLSKPLRRVVFNASARPEDDPELIRKLLAEQLVSPVRWVESIEYALSQGVDHFIEIGPKSVLAAMVKRIAPQARVETRTCA